jgi:hypothetical protein
MKKIIFWLWIVLQGVYIGLILLSQLFVMEQFRYYDEFIVAMLLVLGFVFARLDKSKNTKDKNSQGLSSSGFWILSLGACIVLVIKFSWIYGIILGVIYTVLLRLLVGDKSDRIIASPIIGEIIQKKDYRWSNLHWSWIVLVVLVSIGLSAQIVYIVASPGLYFSKDYSDFIPKVPDLLTIPSKLYYDDLKDINKVTSFVKQKKEDTYVITGWEKEDQDEIKKIASSIQPYNITIKENNNWNQNDQGFSTELAFYPNNKLILELAPNQTNLKGISFTSYRTTLGGQFEYILTDDKSRVLWQGSSSSLDCESIQDDANECIRETISFQNKDIDFKKGIKYLLTFVAQGDFRTKFSEEFGVDYGGYVDVMNIDFISQSYTDTLPSISQTNHYPSYVQSKIKPNANKVVAIAHHTAFSDWWKLSLSSGDAKIIHTEFNYDTNLWVISFGDNEVPYEIDIIIIYTPWFLFRHIIIGLWIMIGGYVFILLGIKIWSMKKKKATA